jgi:phosphopantothenoylcysteine decarboxylase/phosphopantothenate--cysteine ligase
MWNNPIVQDNIKKCKSFGFQVMPTDTGDLACGWIGEGRLAPLQHIRQYLLKSSFPQKLKGKKILISLGPSIEDIDPVRFLSNRSSGKMGIALANAVWAMGADLQIIHGPINHQLPFEASLIAVRSADDFLRETQIAFPNCDIFISTAAIADFRPKKKSAQKIKKNGDKDKDFPLELKRTDDVLASLKKRKEQIVVGFALETNDGYANAKKKLNEKDLDFIVLNVPNLQDSGFEHDTNHGIVISRKEEKELSVMSKELLAFELLNIIFP